MFMPQRVAKLSTIIVFAGGIGGNALAQVPKAGHGTPAKPAVLPTAAPDAVIKPGSLQGQALKKANPNGQEALAPDTSLKTTSMESPSPVAKPVPVASQQAVVIPKAVVVDRIPVSQTHTGPIVPNQPLASPPVQTQSQVAPTAVVKAMPVEPSHAVVSKAPVNSHIQRAKDLMTRQERFEYRCAIRAAKTPEARRRIKALTYSRLGQRAWEHSMALVEFGRWVTTRHWNENTGTHAVWAEAYMQPITFVHAIPGSLHPHVNPHPHETLPNLILIRH